MKKRISIVALSAMLIACNKDIQQTWDFQYERRNINAGPVFFYRGEIVRPDTVFRTDYNTYIQIKSVHLLFSNFYVTTATDTFFTDSLLRGRHFFSLTFAGSTPAGFMRAGTYTNGGYGYFLGLDSAVNFGTRPENYPDNHPLANHSIWEKDAGYDYFQMSGTVTDSTQTDSTRRTVPFLIRVRNLQNFKPINLFQLKNFNINNQSPIKFECYIGLEDVVNLYNLYQRPVVGSTSFTLTSQDSMLNILDRLYIDLQ